MTELPEEYYREKYRPQFHFSPPEKWMNDPNGLVYHQGVYHLFYQYYPDDVVWGPMHWGHAVSSDLLHWGHKPVALYPDALGYIFSGSAVFDKNNTSKLGTSEHPPLVAIFTYHDPEKEPLGNNDHQTQGIAYSLDGGLTWEKYSGNPVIDNKEFADFRDPKVFWDEEQSQWIMLLVAGDHLRIYSSPNLIEWTWLSEFGRDQGAHGGVWECPDMFRLTTPEGEEKWVLLISINPGGPNGGSATQYFVGDFDGIAFTSDQVEVKWVDWGTDNYAGVTYNHTPDGERVFIAWMGNWDYAPKTPTQGWRGAMTLPRTLSLCRSNTSYELKSYPVNAFSKLRNTIRVRREDLPGESRFQTSNFNAAEIVFKTTLTDQKWVFSNAAGNSLVIALYAKTKTLTLDRSNSGVTHFDPSFTQAVQIAEIPHLPEEPFEVRMILDACSVELFLNEGQYTMTSLVFPEQPFTKLSVYGNGEGLQPSFYGIGRVW
ncbi:glycoside hydrolase family 32 protein [Robertkochia sediminum]|uniref:glycoside hydrolase family 32 protein n=1 Tax=Robertkochia sediminum TaxID=2785326 RepID=UPI0019327C98|nr:glycoside hydrolase family 32 protein [Robertkochia sediminum]MBL7473031.1 glycoside hydrolase family 32 protein [Robertkochia sediminum]